MKNKKLKLILLSITNPWNIVSVVIILFCLICIIHERITIKNYIKTDAIYVSECSEYKICDNNYMYEINGVKYGVNPVFETNEKYKKNNYVYYDEDDPSKSIMISNWQYINIFFMLVIIASTVSYYFSLKGNKK